MEEKRYKQQLFRYRSNGKHSVESTLNGKMYFACPLELNDPYEFFIKYDLDKVFDLIKNNQEVKGIIAEKLYGKAVTFGNILDNVFEKYSLDECISFFDDVKRVEQTKKWLRKKIEEKIIQFKESFGIVSFTKNSSEPVMWAHYSNDSNGFLEVFDAKLLLSNFQSYLNSIRQDYSKEQMMVMCAKEISYVNLFPERNEFIVKLLCSSDSTDLNIGIELIDSEETANEVLEIVTSKLESWKYEKEVRLVLPCDIYNYKRKKNNNGQILHDHFFELTPSNPEEIIIGYKASKELEYALRYYCEQKKIELKKSDEYFGYEINY